MVEQLIPFQFTSGIQPNTDRTNLSTTHYTDGNRVRFVDGLPQTIGGWVSTTFDNNNTISGCPRTLFSHTIGSNAWALVGTNTRLYSLLGTELTNITPLVTSTTALADSLDSDYTTLGSDPIDTVLSSTTITINHTGHLYEAGDTITLAGASTTNGVPAGEINIAQIVRTVPDANSYTIIVTTAATSTGSGGGASVVAASGIINVNDTGHGLSDGDRVKIAGAADFAGITANTHINLEHIIRNVSTDDYNIVTGGTATSSVTSGGGASTTRAEQIAAGECDSANGRGYGVGRYGVGKYGVSKTSSNTLTQARIWSMDAYGQNIMMTPGEQTGVYQWTGTTDTAPALLTNAPTAVNYVFVDKEIIVTLGEGATVNRIKWSDRGSSTTWTAAATNQAGSDDIEGAGKFLSHLHVNGINLLFTKNQTYSFRYIGQPFIWETTQLDPGVGIIGQSARVSHGGIGYFMDDKSIYTFNGGSVKEIGGNSLSGEMTVKQYIYENLNTEHQSKCFMWYNKDFNEIWLHYPTGANTECDSYVIYKIKDQSWSIGTMDRSCAEWPAQNTEFPRLIEVDGSFFKHESGVDDDAAALNAHVETPFVGSGVNTMEIRGVIPDSKQTGNITLLTTTKLYPQDTATTTNTETIAPTDGFVPFSINARYSKHKISQNAVGASWRMGTWQEFIDGAERQ